MIDSIYGFVEGRVLAYEAARRGRAHAARAERQEGAIASLTEVPLHLGDAELVSFDLFDTVIHRTRLAPEALTRKTAGFARLIAGERAGNAIFGARHQFARKAKAAMIAKGLGDEPPLGTLFDDALREAGIPDTGDLARRLVAFEAEAERMGIAAVPGAAAVLTNIASSARQVIAISDMYLPGDAINAILDRAGLAGFFDRVYVSSDQSCTKKSSRLYEVVTEEMGLDPSRCLHIGDRMDSDVRPARAAGWRALHLFSEPDIARAEARRIIDSHVPSPALRANDVSRALSIADPGPLGSLDQIVEQVIGPAAGLLVLEALGRMSRIGAGRLYHLSRDATVIGEIAEQARITHPHLAPEGAEILPLSINRVMGGLLTLRQSDDLSKLTHLIPYLTGKPPTAISLIEAFDLPEDAFSDRMRGADGAAFMELVKGDSAVWSAVEAKRRTVEAYLDGTGVTGPDASVVVDIGYSGTFAVQLSEMLFGRAASGERIECLFLLTSCYLKGNLRLLHPRITLSPGVAMDYRRRSSRWASWNFAWAEPFFVDPDRGRLRGYADGAPVFDPSPLNDQIRGEQRALRAAIRARALRFIDDFHRSTGDTEEIAALLQSRMERLAGRPRRAEERAMRQLSHQSGQTAINVGALTRPVNPLHLWSELKSMRDNDYWVQGSLSRSGLGLVNRAMSDAPTVDRRADPRMMWD